MDETLRQVGGLLLGAVPTIIFVLGVYGIYKALVHRPLVRVLADRRSKTEGAVETARANIASAEARTADYERRLREARAAIFKGLEARRQGALQRRTEAIAEARARAQAELEAARNDIERYKQEAKAELESEAKALANAIIRTVLEPAATGARQ